MEVGGVCSICGSPRALFGKTTLLEKYEVAYFRCERCGFVQTEKPYWLPEAYSDAIAASDLGLVSRNVHLADATRAIISRLFDARGRFLDYGGGYGLLVRLMRDQGFDFYRDDPMCENIFARGFDRPDDGPFELVTAYEVLEHLPDPVKDVGRMLQFSGSLLFSTMLLPDPPPAPGEWWYFATDSGQHVSLYTRASLDALAERVSVYAATSHTHLHLLTKNRRALRWFDLVSRPKSMRLLNMASRSRVSLIADDYERVTGRRLGA